MVETYKKNTRGRVPPQDIDAEKALIGSLMLRPSGMNEIEDVIRDDSFYVEKHRIIYTIIRELADRHEPVDLISVASRLKEQGHLDSVGGRSYLTELTNAVPSSTNIGYYGDIVTRKSVLRTLIETGDFVSSMGYSEAADLEDTLDQVEKRVFGITTNSSSAKKFQGIGSILPKTKETIARLHASSDELRGVSTGFDSMDKLLAGFMPADLIILAARPSMGKTALSLDIARNSALKHGTHVGFFSLEMSSQQLVDRMVASEARVDAWKLRTGNALTDQDMDAMTAAMERLEKAPIYIDDQPGNTILKMRSTARRLKSEHGLDMIVVDYLQLILPTRNFDSMVNQITEISRSLKNLARELDVPVLCLSQLSRAVESRGGRPRLSDLRDSGAIEQDADVVMFIHREPNEEEGTGKSEASEILIEKHRNGPTGKIDMNFNSAKTTFEEVAAQGFDDYGM